MKVKPVSIEFSPYWEPEPLPWWKRIFLPFKRTRVSIDVGHGQDYGVKCFYKWVDGKPHIIRWELIERGE